MSIEFWGPLLIAAGTVGFTIYTAYQNRRKIEAEAESIESKTHNQFIESAVQLVERTERDNEMLREKVAGLESRIDVLEQQLATERRGNIELSQRNDKLANENKQLAARVGALESVIQSIADNRRDDN